MKKRFLMLFTVMAFICSLMYTPVFAVYKLRYPPTGLPLSARVTKTYKVTKVSKVRDEYSMWHRLSGPEYCHDTGEQAGYAEGKSETITTTSSISLEFPVKKVQVALGLEYTIAESTFKTIKMGLSKPMERGSYAAYYYRNHWICYNVEYEVTTTSYSYRNGLLRPSVSTVGMCKLIKVAQDFEPEDYGWFYAPAGNKSALKENLDTSYCVGYTCYAS